MCKVKVISYGGCGCKWTLTEVVCDEKKFFCQDLPDFHLESTMSCEYHLDNSPPKITTNFGQYEEPADIKEHRNKLAIICEKIVDSGVDGSKKGMVSLQQAVEDLCAKLDKLIKVSERVVMAMDESTCKNLSQPDARGSLNCMDVNCSFHKKGYHAPVEGV